MFKKLKKHKLSLFLLAMVCMLSVYYILMPNEDVNAPVANIPDGITRYQEFAEMRLEIIDERNILVNEYEEKIIAAEVSLDDTTKYVNEINNITNLTGKEVYIEEIVMNLGYEDCLVYLVNENNLAVNILSDKFDVSDYEDIALAAIEEFGERVLVTVTLVKSS